MAWIERRHLTKLSGGKEQFSYRVCWRDPKGRRRYETRPTRAAAEKYKRQIEHSQDVGTYRDPSLGKVMLDEFFRHHMETTTNLAPKTRDLYECQWRVHVEPRMGHLRLNAISKADVKSFLSGLREDGVPEMTIGAVHRLLRAVLSVAVDEERISANPAARIRLPAPTKGERVFFSPEQVDALADAVDDRFITLIYLLAYCGPRIGEAAALRVKHVDLLGRRVMIEEAAKEVTGGLITGPTKTKKARSVALPVFLRDMLAYHIATFSDRSDPEALVFTSVTGRQLRPSGVRKRVVKPALAKAGLPTSARTHDLRHTAAAIAISARFHPKEIQEMLGHSSINVTFGTYAHLLASQQEDSAGRLDAVYAEARERPRRDVSVVELPAKVLLELEDTGT